MGWSHVRLNHCRHQESRREWGAHQESRGERAVRGPVGSVAHCGKYQWSRVGPPKPRSFSLLLETPAKFEAKTFKNHFRNHRYLLNPPESLGRGAAQLLVGGGEGGPAKAHTGADHLAPAKAVLVLPCPSSVIRLSPESRGRVGPWCQALPCTARCSQDVRSGHSQVKLVLRPCLQLLRDRGRVLEHQEGNLQ